jgi:hypothetical protein
MGAADLPPDPAKVTAGSKGKVAEVRKVKSQPSDVALKNLVDKINKAAVPSSGQVTNEGQIVRMSIPAGWSKSTIKHTLPSTANFVEVNNNKDQKAKVFTYYRGHRISPVAGKDFHQILQSGPRDLTDTEYAGLAEVVRDKAKADDFTVTAKKVVNLNGRKVLLVEGMFKESKERAHSFYIDADDTGEVVQEVAYQAPDAIFDAHKKEADAALNSIVWK